MAKEKKTKEKATRIRMHKAKSISKVVEELMKANKKTLDYLATR
jgi:hypothetical protein